MLQDAANVAMLRDAPWTLAPAAAIFLVVLGVNIAVRTRADKPTSSLR
jgi:ABC-type dipeptide/oligopeptide/nickel transport system permease subunit